MTDTVQLNLLTRDNLVGFKELLGSREFGGCFCAVQAVAAEAVKNDASYLEAYPTRPFHEPRIFRGTHQLYRKLGFVESTAEKDGDFEIVLMRLALKDAI